MDLGKTPDQGSNASRTRRLRRWILVATLAALCLGPTPAASAATQSSEPLER